MPEEPITLRDVFNAVEPVKQCLVEIKVSLAVLTQRDGDLHIAFTGHLDDHKRVRTLWQRPFIGAIVGAVEMIIIGLVGFFIGRG